MPNSIRAIKRIPIITKQRITMPRRGPSLGNTNNINTKRFKNTLHIICSDRKSTIESALNKLNNFPVITKIPNKLTQQIYVGYGLQWHQR